MSTSFQLDGFDNIEYLGQGGLAVVYRAHQIAFDRIVALKVMRVGSEDDAAAKLFEKECAAAGRLAWHPNVASVFERGVADNHLYMVTEYYEGGTLAQEVQRRGPLPVEEVLSLGIKLCGALGTAHDEGILHRDIKPQNVLLSALGEPALTDFGLAAIAGHSATTTGFGFSPAFSPPEVYSGASPNARGDLYSLAATLFHAACGRAPFGRAGATTASIIGDVMSGRTIDLPPELSESAVCPVVLKGLATVPADRFASAGEFASALQELQRSLNLTVTDVPTADAVTRPPAGAEQPASESRSSPPSDGIGAAPTTRRRKRALVGAGLVVALAAGGALGVAAMDDGDTSVGQPSDSKVESSQGESPVGFDLDDPCRDVALVDSFETVLGEHQLGLVWGDRVDAPDDCVLPTIEPSADTMMAGESALGIIDGATWSSNGSQPILEPPATASFVATNYYPGAPCWAINIPRAVIVDSARTLWTQDRYWVAVNFFDMATDSDADALFALNSLTNGALRGECSGFDADGLAEWPEPVDIEYQDVELDVDGVRINLRGVPGINGPKEFALTNADHLYRMTSVRGSRMVEIDLVSHLGPINEARVASFFREILGVFYPPV